MRKRILVTFSFLALLVAACDDGNLQIETLDFDSVSAESCDSPITTSTSIYFKINGDEVLILDLASGLLANQVTEAPRTSSFPTNSSLTYRIFNGSVSSSYFCDDIPPISPVVIEEIQASSGTVMVSTSSEDGITFTHTIELEGVTLLNGTNERITDLSINEFGTVTTTN